MARSIDFSSLFGAPVKGSRRSSSALTIASLLLAAIIGAVVLWLALTAETTIAERQAAIPKITVPVVRQSAVTGAPEPTAVTDGRSAVAVAEPATPTPAPATTPATATPTALSTAPPAGNLPHALGATLALAPAPIAALIEESAAGPLPRVGGDGTSPWQAYARPFDQADPRPRIAIVMADMGLSATATATAVEDLPGPVSLAFTPYADQLDRWIRTARERGHEVLLSVPMEPATYPRDDPGPNTLLTTLSAERNRERLEWVLGRATGYVGVTTLTGSRFTADALSLKPMLEQIDRRGLLYLDSRVASRSAAPDLAETLRAPIVISDGFIDQVASRAAIDEALAKLETAARRDGHAVGIAYPYPVTFERLGLWFQGLEAKGFVLAPVSAVVGGQAAQASPSQASPSQASR